MRTHWAIIFLREEVRFERRRPQSRTKCVVEPGSRALSILRALGVKYLETRDRISPLLTKLNMNTDQPVLKELNQRKSVRGFLPKEIESEKLDVLWAAAQWAPSSANKQEWHYYAVTGEARQKLAEVLNQGNQWALKAPLILGVTRDGSIENKTESREYGMYDVALSVMSLVVEVEHQGLRAHQMAGFKDEAFRRVLSIQEKEIPVVMIAVGYEGEAKGLDPIVQAKEDRPRTRKPINEVVKILENL